MRVSIATLLASYTGIGPMVGEARLCESKSLRFKGPCLSSTNCASVCHSEGFPSGDCRGFRRRCFCLIRC
ncbi:defensin-like protein isoform X1 [Primulina tabacum]|uniref:defensin-like protein isoform X1 n=1 Tax=Primulina tabacum TaxID=48773 RepID=UPI003F59B9FE